MEPVYKKWRFNAEDQPSRSTLWRRRKRKQKVNSEDELCENEISRTCKRKHEGDSLILGQDQAGAERFNQFETSNAEVRQSKTTENANPYEGKRRTR